MVLLRWIKASAALSSLCCLAPLCSAVVSSPADSGPNTLRAAMQSLDPALGGIIVFDPGLSGSTISLLSPLPSLSGAHIVINDPSGPVVKINGQGSVAFLAYAGNLEMSNLLIEHAASVGGAGGAGGGGGGGGMGAGGGLFVNSGVTALLTNVAFSSNWAQGGTGGAFVSAPPGSFSVGGGGGGGAFFGVSAVGGSGNVDDITTFVSGGGGGGGGSGPGFPGGPTGQGGTGGGPGGGTGGHPGSSGLRATDGGSPMYPFSGGGGGGGAYYGPTALAGNGGTGALFGGGGGAGAIIDPVSSVPSVGGGGGFGGGGGGGFFEKNAPITGNPFAGGWGGFGGGGGGSGAASSFGGGMGGTLGGPFRCGGGGGAGLGGGLFIAEGGHLTLKYTSSTVGPTAISNNSATGGVGGDNLASEAGKAYGQDLFLMSGGVLDFFVNVPLTISTAIDSDPLNAGETLVFVEGSDTLTLLGQNTFDGKVIVRNGGELAVASDAALGLTASGTAALVLDGGTLRVMDSAFSLSRPLYVGDGGATLSVTGGASVLFDGVIAPNPGAPLQNGSVSIVGGGTARFSGHNTYRGMTIVGPSAGLEILSVDALPAGGTVVLSGGVLDFPGLTGTIPNAIEGEGFVSVDSGASLVLTGVNTYGGTTSIAPGATLGIGASAAASSNSAFVDEGALSFQNTSGIAYPGPISGTGAVLMDGTGGFVALTGTDTYLGDTFFNRGTIQVHSSSALGAGDLIFDGGTLEFLTPFTGPLSATAFLLLPSGGVMSVDSGVSALDEGVITGAGPFQCTGGGVLMLSGSNTYTNTTTIGPNATLEILDIASLPAGSTVIDSGDLVFQLSAALSSIPNLIQGSGIVSLIGPNRFRLTNVANTYSGGTGIGIGTLQVSNFAPLGSGPVAMQAGGTLELLAPGPYSTARSFIVGAGGGRLQLDALVAFSYSGSILGADPFSIVGAGQMTYSGQSALSALTTLGDGSLGNGNLTLQGATFAGPMNVSAGALLDGQGSMGSLSNFGTVHLDLAKTIAVSGDYTQAGPALLRVQVEPGGQCGQIFVTQTAHLDGTLEVDASPGTYVFGTEYTVLTSGNLLLSSFSSIQKPFFLVPIYTRDPSLVLVVISPSVLDGAHVRGHNPTQVLENLQEIVQTPTLDLITVIDAMSGMDETALTNALNQLHPAPFGAFDLLNANTGSQLTSIFSRESMERCCTHLNRECSCTTRSLWLQPFGSASNQVSKGEQIGFHALALGLAGGLNFCQSDGLLLGVGGAYSATEVKWEREWGKGCMDKASVALYGDLVKGRFSAEASLVGSLDILRASRHIHFSTIDRHAMHEKGGSDLTGHLGGSADFRSKQFFFRPFVNVDYLYFYQKGFAEVGAQSLDLSVRGRRFSTLRSEVGLSVTRSFKVGEQGCFAPTLWLSGIDECQTLQSHYTSHFAEETIWFTSRTWDNCINFLSPGLDLSWLFDCGIGLSLRYSAELSSPITTQKLDGRFEWFF